MEDVGAQQALAHYLAGEQHLQLGAWQAAAQAFRQALALDPQFVEAHANLGYALDRSGDPVAAEGHYRQAVQLAPAQAALHLNLGALLAQHKRHAEAEASYAAALALEPTSSAVWSNLGALNLNLQRTEDAEACLRQAIMLEPDNAKARFNLAYLQLRQGQFEEGWALFEARDWYQPLQQRLELPRWDGAPVQRLLVTYEAGHGDVIQFCRYVPLLKARGARHITLLCHPALTELMRSLDGLDAVLGYDMALPASGFDSWMPLLSAPYLCGTRSDTIPAPIPYLHAKPVRMAQWAPRLPPPVGPRIGLVWKGNPQFENDRDRSLPHLQALEPLWAVPGLQWVSLQKGEAESDVLQCQVLQPLCDLGGQMQDFADAAALVAQLDLVITVDTAMAHLAGALGKPCWVLLPWYMGDWRWGVTGSTTAWYPAGLRLYRQPQDGDWASVVHDVAAALRDLYGHPSAAAR